MSWAIVGSNGMLGADLVASLTKKNLEAVAFTRENLNLDIGLTALTQTLAGFDVIVNCVGYAAVDDAESNQNEAKTVNGSYAGLLANVAAAVGARFVHISTDYVFDGLGSQPYKTDDPMNPLNVYGESKALGEQLVAVSGADYSVLRTSWLYSAGGKNFAKTIARNLKDNGSVRVVNDQFGQPTWTLDLAEQVFEVAKLEKMPRTVHAVSSGQASWADFAREIAKSLGIDVESVIEVSSSEFRTAAKRPVFSVLDNSTVGIEPIGDWRERWAEAAPFVLDEFLGEKRP